MRLLRRLRPWQKLLLSLSLFLLALVFFLLGTNAVSSGNRTREREALQRAVTETVTVCYALEGAYPESLAYMKENYGLTWNESRFYIDYRVLGGNLRPEITIIERGGDS